MRRVEERRAFPDEVSRTRQIVEILLGIRSGFSDAASNDNAASRSPLDMSRVEMENMLIQMRIDHPEWRENAGQDAGADDLMLQNFHKAIEDGDLVGMLQCIPRMRHPISHRDVAGETALHVACLHGREEEVQLLLVGVHLDRRALARSLSLSLALSRTFDALRARSFARIWDTPRTRAAWTARHRWPTPRAVALPTWSLCSACERLTASIWSTSTAMGHCTMPQGASMAM